MSRTGETAEAEQLRYAWRVLSVVSMASILIALGSSSLNVALPDVVRHFDAGAAAANWILLSYMLANTVLLVVFGRLADMFGRRTMYLLGLATYTAASLLLGFAPGAWFLVGLRVVQAAGGAMLLANSAALLADAFPPRHMARGMGVYIASFSVAQLVGPTLGGYLTHRFGWEWVFWYNVPIGLVCLVRGAVVLRRVGGRGGDRGIDLPGNLLVPVGLGGLLIGLSEVGDRSWGDPVVVTCLALFALLVPLFLVVERRSARPVVDVGLFRDVPFALGLLTSFLNAVSRMAVVLLIALFYQAVHGEDPVSAGLKVLPLPVAAMIASACSGMLHSRLAPRTIVLISTSVGTAGLLVLLLEMSVGVGYAPIACGLVLVGVGSGMFMPANTTAMLDGIAPDRIGIVNAMRLMIQNTGVVVSTALAMSLVTRALPAGLRDRVFDGTISRVAPHALGQLVTGYRLALLVMAVISALAVLASLGRPRSADDPAEAAGRTRRRSPAPDGVSPPPPPG
ncbi:MFS transporter [Streptomyces sp. NPDC048430]|uniref:MFS transporter n=1 Tax=Streptomyces sp. NPDC048430 TaxID=3155388 RepID=UPI0034358894